jgi:hypothetical protein
LSGQSSVEKPDDPSVELAFWETVKDSGNKDMIEAYLRKYPHGEFRELADIMLAANSAGAP